MCVEGSSAFVFAKTVLTGFRDSASVGLPFSAPLTDAIALGVAKLFHMSEGGGGDEGNAYGLDVDRVLILTAGVGLEV